MDCGHSQTSSLSVKATLSEGHSVPVREERRVWQLISSPPLANRQPEATEGVPMAAQAHEQSTDTIAKVDIRELQHRVKNMMAVVQSLCRQTMRECETKEEFEKQFSARLSSYSKSIDLLVAGNWLDIDMADLVHAQLSTFGGLDGIQIAATGPKLRISGQGAHILGLALHELATNAVKYGSLSVPEGRVAIEWSMSETNSSPRFCLVWQETGGPAVSHPAHRGFGSRIIEKFCASALSGKTQFQFLPDGVRWSIDAPA